MRFMVEGTPNGNFTNDMMAQLPAETARGKELAEQGLRSAIYVSADYSKAWQIFTAETETDVQRALESLPLYGATDYRITPLSDDQ